MLKLYIKEVEVEDDDRCFVDCEDEYGNTYRFPMTYKKARIIALLITEAYIPQDSIYEFVIKLFNEINLYIDSVVINNIHNNKAKIIIKDDKTDNIISFNMSIPDALILHLMSNSSLYMDKEIKILLEEEVGKFFWYRFLKELDLC